MPFIGHAYALLVLLAMIGIPIALIVWAVLRFSPRPPADSPLNILKARFARGEIDQKEYEERKRALEQG